MISDDEKQNGEVPRTAPFSGVKDLSIFFGSLYCRLIVPAFSQQVFWLDIHASPMPAARKICKISKSYDIIKSVCFGDPSKGGAPAAKNVAVSGSRS
jgi:hypothetical protein